MYNLPYHKERDPDVIKAFIAEYPFAFLTGCDANGAPVATQIPLFMEDEGGRGVLRGHMMRNMDHHRAFAQNNSVLAVFSGPQIYVSGTWYSDPHTPSTWNYMSVHVRGTMRFLDGDALEDMLRKTSLHFENLDASSATVYDNLPAELTKRLLKMIVAFEITVTDVDTVFKLSQDRDLASYRNIIERLREKGENGRRIAEEMAKRTALVFPDS